MTTNKSYWSTETQTQLEQSNNTHMKPWQTVLWGNQIECAGMRTRRGHCALFGPHRLLCMLFTDSTKTCSPSGLEQSEQSRVFDSKISSFHQSPLRQRLPVCTERVHRTVNKNKPRFLIQFAGIKETKQTQQREEKADYGLVWLQDGVSVHSPVRILPAERKCGETTTKGGEKIKWTEGRRKRGVIK